jgi:curved DNA-binding protein CbpA
MENYFEMLGLASRPWMEPEDIKKAFLRAAALCHPDAKRNGENGQFTQINLAYTTLREPAARLRYLLAHNRPEEGDPAAASPERIPARWVDLFMEMAAQQQQVTSFLKKKELARSALAVALLSGESAEMRRACGVLAARLDEMWADCLERLREWDRAWPGDAAVAGLEVLQKEFNYLGRWRDQLREALVLLTV